MTASRSRARARAMADVNSSTYVKTYIHESALRRAVGNYQWLSAAAPSLRLPRVIAQTAATVVFERLPGKHAKPENLPGLAAHLGAVHAEAHLTCLRKADLRTGLRAELHDGSGHTIPGFLERRLRAVRDAIQLRRVPHPLLRSDEAEAIMLKACASPATFYKDSNCRNLLVDPTSEIPAMCDFDDLSLAPFGYDLAKLVVSLVMTYGRLPSDAIVESLAVYNSAAKEREPTLPAVDMPELLHWAEIHHILTCGYAGQHGYRYAWAAMRPQP